jgi:hypothetical protein
VCATGLSVTAAHAQSDTIFPHPDTPPFYLGGQVNVISQHHGDFTSPYQAGNSLRPETERATSLLTTFYGGLSFGGGWEAVVHIESAGGKGISDALGLAGFTNLDVVRNPALGATPYLARLLVRKTFRLGDGTIEQPRTPLALATVVPSRRIDVRAGKLGIADFFDLNAVGSDSHLQFTNWTVDNNGGYDYAADTRGYTYGVVIEYASPGYSIRGAEALMPKVANGIELDWHLTRARGENVELEWRPSFLTLRLLGYVNHANMGSYQEAIDAFHRGEDAKPTIERHRQQGRVKYGTGLNAERSFEQGVRLFARAGWNEGRNESFAYTEANDSAALGGDVSGAVWRRHDDRAGVAIVTNGLSSEHREYLRLGGLGFLLGDGTLRYGRENIVESYYTARLWRGVSASGGLQYIRHPGYNQDRGPVLVDMVRVHLDF